MHREREREERERERERRKQVRVFQWLVNQGMHAFSCCLSSCFCGSSSWLADSISRRKERAVVFLRCKIKAAVWCTDWISRKMSSSRVLRPILMVVKTLFNEWIAWSHCLEEKEVPVYVNFAVVFAQLFKQGMLITLLLFQFYFIILKVGQLIIPIGKKWKVWRNHVTRLMVILILTKNV